MNNLNFHEASSEVERIGARLNELNNSSPDIVYRQFMRCCGSSKWARRMEEARPFKSLSEIEQTADRIWTACSSEDWLEAFAAHPRIGQQCQSHWSRQEQIGVAAAASEILAALARANRQYEMKFGYIFIVCATGKTALEILAMLQKRNRNDSCSELKIAAEQQRLITRMRLRKLLSE